MCASVSQCVLVLSSAYWCCQTSTSQYVSIHGQGQPTRGARNFVYAIHFMSKDVQFFYFLVCQVNYFVVLKVYNRTRVKDNNFSGVRRPNIVNCDFVTWGSGQVLTAFMN